MSERGNITVTTKEVEFDQVEIGKEVLYAGKWHTVEGKTQSHLILDGELYATFTGLYEVRES